VPGKHRHADALGDVLREHGLAGARLSLTWGASTRSRAQFAGESGASSIVPLGCSFTWHVKNSTPGSASVTRWALTLNHIVQNGVISRNLPLFSDEREEKTNE
jgi:hypothetical protein